MWTLHNRAGGFRQGDSAMVEKLNETTVRVCCAECGEKITLEFGDLPRAEAQALIDKLDRTPRECPGFHVELSGWKRMWHLDEALAMIYGPVAEEVCA